MAAFDATWTTATSLDENGAAVYSQAVTLQSPQNRRNQNCHRPTCPEEEDDDASATVAVTHGRVDARLHRHLVFISGLRACFNELDLVNGLALGMYPPGPVLSPRGLVLACSDARVFSQNFSFKI